MATMKKGRTEVVTFRLTAAERSRLAAAAASASMSESAYLRALIDGSAEKIVQIPIDGSRLDAISHELKKSGTNLNQIARRTNRGERIAPAEFAAAMDEHRTAAKRLSDFIDETRPAR